MGQLFRYNWADTGQLRIRWRWVRSRGEQVTRASNRISQGYNSLFNHYTLIHSIPYYKEFNEPRSFVFLGERSRGKILIAIISRAAHTYVDDGGITIYLTWRWFHPFDLSSDECELPLTAMTNQDTLLTTCHHCSHIRILSPRPCSVVPIPFSVKIRDYSGYCFPRAIQPRKGSNLDVNSPYLSSWFQNH